jgi:tryptophanyl-tRNA synthetase
MKPGRREGSPLKRLVSGIRPSGALHLGHYAGVLKQLLRYQDEYECFCMIADIQTLATHMTRPDAVHAAVRDVALDWLAVGLDPQESCFFVQSQIPEFTELTIYLQHLVRTFELQKNRTVREEARALGKGSLYDELGQIDFGFLGYPVSQAADILLFSSTPPVEGDSLIVPVGEDQLPHIEFAQTLARRFNSFFGPVFLEPEARTSPDARLPGTGGGFKMGKSLRNAIFLNDPQAEYASKLRRMFTDPLRVHAGDPGHPDGCLAFAYLHAFGNPSIDLEARDAACRQGQVDCNDCREELVRDIHEILEPIQERRAAYATQPDLLEDVLTEGTRRARVVAQGTIEHVREAMNLTYPGLVRSTEPT